MIYQIGTFAESRRRFWRSENNTDKTAAYITLHSVLSDLLKIISPVAPFISDHIYQNLSRNLDLKNNPISIHLCDFPIFDEKNL